MYLQSKSSIYQARANLIIISVNSESDAQGDISCQVLLIVPIVHNLLMTMRCVIVDAVHTTTVHRLLWQKDRRNLIHSLETLNAVIFFFFFEFGQSTNTVNENEHLVQA